jgi:hypothetical protein
MQILLKPTKPYEGETRVSFSARRAWYNELLLVSTYTKDKMEHSKEIGEGFVPLYKMMFEEQPIHNE